MVSEIQCFDTVAALQTNCQENNSTNYEAITSRLKSFYHLELKNSRDPNVGHLRSQVKVRSDIFHNASIHIRSTPPLYDVQK